MSEVQTDSPQKTPLYALHVELGARLVPFAGYGMPVQFSAGIIAEHTHTRAAASLFDVSHMGQVALRGADAAAALESLVPGDIQGLGAGRMRYTQFTNEAGGILDDLMVTNAGDHLFVVVNATRKEADLARMHDGLSGRVTVEPLPDRALLALQGPKAVEVLARLAPECRDMVFLSAAVLSVDGIECFVTRSGYTGEDGFEISLPGEAAERLARRLLAEEEVAPAGLGARDSLRLEAGMCLYGHDIDERTTPVEAALTWSIGKRRRREGGFPGDAVIQSQLAEGVTRKRVGILPDGRAPAREHTGIFADEAMAEPIGKVTSGGFGPSVGGPVCMGYVATKSAAAETGITLDVRRKARPARVVKMPFVQPNYYRGK